jgi:hypothetical protein
MPVTRYGRNVTVGGSNYWLAAVAIFLIKSLKRPIRVSWPFWQRSTSAKRTISVRISVARFGPIQVISRGKFLLFWLSEIRLVFPPFSLADVPYQIGGLRLPWRVSGVVGELTLSLSKFRYYATRLVCRAAHIVVADTWSLPEDLL